MAVKRPQHVRLIMRHPVGDYTVWRRTYDAFAEQRCAMGATAAAVYQSVEDPADITVCTEFATVHAARAFAGSDAVRAWMAQAGVAGRPELWLVTER